MDPLQASLYYPKLESREGQGPLSTHGVECGEVEEEGNKAGLLMLCHSSHAVFGIIESGTPPRPTFGIKQRTLILVLYCALFVVASLFIDQLIDDGLRILSRGTPSTPLDLTLAH